MLRVDDIMQTGVVTVQPDMTVPELARVLAQHDISGAPVVDSSGEVLGVVSNTDVIRLAANESEVRLASISATPDEDRTGRIDDDTEEDVVDYFVNTAPSRTDLSPEWTGETDLDQYLVREIMTPAHFRISPTATIAELASFMVRGRIHRALVMQDERLEGIVSTMDVLRTVAGQP